MSLSIQVAHDPALQAAGAARVVLSGRIDTETAPELETRLRPLLDGSVKSLILDLGGVDFVSSAGLRVLMAARKAMGQGGRVAFTRMQPQVEKVFEIVKALGGVAVFASQAEEDEYLADIQRRAVKGER